MPENAQKTLKLCYEPLKLRVLISTHVRQWKILSCLFFIVFIIIFICFVILKLHKGFRLGTLLSLTL